MRIDIKRMISHRLMDMFACIEGREEIFENIEFITE
jgi:hypothetical protein